MQANFVSLRLRNCVLDEPSYGVVVLFLPLYVCDGSVNTGFVISLVSNRTEPDLHMKAISRGG